LEDHAVEEKKRRSRCSEVGEVIKKRKGAPAPQDRRNLGSTGEKIPKKKRRPKSDRQKGGYSKGGILGNSFIRCGKGKETREVGKEIGPPGKKVLKRKSAPITQAGGWGER